MRQSSILKRMLTFFSITILPVIILGICLQWKINQSMSESILSSSSDRIQDYVQKLDNKFAETNHLMGDILSNGIVKRIANPNDPMDAYERVSNVNFVRNLLNNIKLSNPSINYIRLYLPLVHVRYTTDNAYDYQAQKYLGSTRELSDEDWQELLNLRQTPSRSYLYQENLVFLQYSSHSRPDFILETVYSAASLAPALEDTLLYEDALYFFTTEKREFQITNCSDSALTDLVLQESLQENAVFQYKGKKYYLFYFPLPTADAWYVQLIPSDLLIMNLSVATYYTIIFTIAVLLFGLLFAFGSFRILQKPVNCLTDAFHKIENRNFKIRIGTPPLSDFGYLYQSFDHMAEQLNQLIEKELRQELLLQKSQLKQLQAQINPHFLYNSFFMLNQMIARDMNDSARELAGELGNYFKYVTRNGKDRIPLIEEYQHALTYASIQAKRFAGRINVNLEPLPADYADIPVPRLILQPFLENAFQYGMADKMHDGLILMRFEPDAGSLTVIFEDNGESFSDQSLQELNDKLSKILQDSYIGEITGIFNIARRLTLFYGRTDTLKIERSGLGGLLISISLFREGDHVSIIDC